MIPSKISIEFRLTILSSIRLSLPSSNLSNSLPHSSSVPPSPQISPSLPDHYQLRNCSLYWGKNYHLHYDIDQEEGVANSRRKQVGWWLLLSMINPFLSNNDTLLFRKNYQVIAKPPPTPSLAPHSSGKIQFLQSRNPFVGSNPLQHPLSQSRSLSPATLPLNHSRVALGKSRMREQDWKREFQSKEREKLQVYGAEGLRYNAYPEYSARQPANDYYGYSKPENSYKAPPVRQKLVTESTVAHYPPLERNQQQIDSGKSKKTKEVFHDDVNESEMMGSKAWGRLGAQVDRINEEDEGRQSNLKDMFSSEYGDKFKRSLGYGSVYGDEMADSKNGHKQSERREQRFYESRAHENWRASPLVESTVRRMDVIAPGSISFQGKVYQRVPL